MRGVLVVIVALLLASLAYAKDWPEDSLKVPARAVAKIDSAQAGYRGVLESLRKLRTDSTQIAGTMNNMQGGKLVPVLWPDRVIYLKTGDAKGAKATLEQYQALLKSYAQGIAQETARGEGFIKTVLDLTGWKDRERAIKCLEAR